VDGAVIPLAFVIEHAYVDALACFREPIKHFARLGYQVDVYTRLTPSHPPPSFADANIRLIPIDVTYAGTLRLVAQLATRRYAVIFTVPRWSLHWTVMAARGTPVAYISDELIADDGKWKTRERRDHARCAFSIALSDERAAYLRTMNQLPAGHPVYIVPNAAPGPAVRRPSRYYQDYLGIPDDRCLLVHAGGMGWSPLASLAAAAERWDDTQPALVFQGRLPAQMRGRTNRGGVWYSQTTVPSDLLDYVVSSARIGLALYDDAKPNDRLMGIASGKLCLYMKNALPVITTRLDCFAWVERERCGLTVGSVDEIPDAARAIEREYETYACNVRRYYAEHLDFTRTIAPVTAAVARLAEGRRW
jgi:hypothetical protein